MRLSINGETHEVDVEPIEPLLWVLRDKLGLTGTRYGCGAGVCGACTVHLNGAAVRSCVVPAVAVADQPITTIEGLAPDERVLHPVQQAFIEHRVTQCGWCMNGQVMTAAAFLAANPSPSPDAVTAAMAHNLCRCGAYRRICAAVLSAAGGEEAL